MLSKTEIDRRRTVEARLSKARLRIAQTLRRAGVTPQTFAKVVARLVALMDSPDASVAAQAAKTLAVLHVDCLGLKSAETGPNATQVAVVITLPEWMNTGPLSAHAETPRLGETHSDGPSHAIARTIPITERVAQAPLDTIGLDDAIARTVPINTNQRIGASLAQDVQGASTVPTQQVVGKGPQATIGCGGTPTPPKQGDGRGAGGETDSSDIPEFKPVEVQIVE